MLLFGTSKRYKTKRNKTKSINWNVRPMCLSTQWRLTQTIQVHQVHTHSHTALTRHKKRKKEIFWYNFYSVLYSRHLCKSTLLLVEHKVSGNKKDPNALSAQDVYWFVVERSYGVEWRIKLSSEGGIKHEDTNEMDDLIWLRKFGAFHFTTGYALSLMRCTRVSSLLDLLGWCDMPFDFLIE